VLLRGCAHVQLTQVRAAGFGVDGFYVGAARNGGWNASTDVTLDGCVMENCRRQGVSVTGCTGFHMVQCEAHGIGPDLPGSGVDLEPNPDRKVVDAEIRGCSFHDNTGFGIMVGGAGGENLVLADNRIQACRRGGILVKSSTNARVTGNTIDGSEPAISVRGRTSGVRLEQNVCTTGTIEVVRPATAELVGNHC
ncbi:MAG TPA: right-handed parallel beta-helix repeat-containing protein, partial [Longimicrobiales bacterium]|nr:right-handed parallel beta-helix repeat-containing protein [Longimicrobiales bacterium]